LSVPAKKNISSAGLVSSSPVGGDAVKNSLVVSKFFAILDFCYRRERQSLLRSCSGRKLSEALAMQASPGLTYRDHLADPADSHHGVNFATKAEGPFLLLFWFLLAAREANVLVD
jgi:hypothetical protein